MNIGGRELKLKARFTLREEKTVSIGLRKIGEALIEWMRDEESPAEKLDELNKEWQALSSQMFEGPVPHIDELGSEGLLEVTEGFFQRGSRAKK